MNEINPVIELNTVMNEIQNDTKLTWKCRNANGNENTFSKNVQINMKCLFKNCNKTVITWKMLIIAFPVLRALPFWISRHENELQSIYRGWKGSRAVVKKKVKNECLQFSHFAPYQWHHPCTLHTQQNGPDGVTKKSSIACEGATRKTERKRRMIKWR